MVSPFALHAVSAASNAKEAMSSCDPMILVTIRCKVVKKEEENALTLLPLHRSFAVENDKNTMAEQQKYIGLTSSQVDESREKHGRNTLTPPKPTPAWKLYLEKFKDPMIIVLLVALLLSFGVAIHEMLTVEGAGFESLLEPLGILFAVLLSTGVAFFFEQKAAKEFNLLNQVNDETLYKLIRNGELCQVAKHEIVVGDVLLIENGEELPADGKLIESTSLQVNESSLTGEPVANKYAEVPADIEETPYPANMVYRGSTVTEGHAVVEVTEVGDATEAGKVFKGVTMANDVATPLQTQLTRFAKVISYFGYLVAFLIVVGRVVIFLHEGRQNDGWLAISEYFLNAFMLAVAVLVVSIPEGLPMSVSLSLAYSMRSMMKTNNLVRKMHATETMGATTVICTDKTGTLTQNQMRVHRVFGADGSEIGAEHPLLGRIYHSIAVNTTAYLEKTGEDKLAVLGNPTEGALLLWMHGLGQDYGSLRDGAKVGEQLTFSTERKYMATHVLAHDGVPDELLIKGAPEIIMSLCDSAIVAQRGDIVPLPSLRQELLSTLEGFQKQGMRTLALATREVRAEEGLLFADGRVAVSGFTLLALVAINDPVRVDVPAAIREVLEAGVNVKIVTGDTILTTREIARQIGLWDDTCGEESAMSGTEFAAMSDEEVILRLNELKVMYRARPLDKARLTRLLQAQGEVVAVTGDGTNDAPALRAAHVGLSMGDGTSVAKEASDITILDNSFVSIGQAILWGRSLYQNIQRFIVFQLTINLAACLIVIIGAFIGEKSPLTVTQMLWVNLIIDTFAALALASLPPDHNVMQRKPRKTSEFIVGPGMVRAIVRTSLFIVAVLYAVLWLFQHTHVGDGSTLLGLVQHGVDTTNPNFAAITPYELSLFFSFFVFIQVWNLFNAKAFQSGRSAFYEMRHCRPFLGVVLLIVVCQWLMMAFGGQMFNLVPLRFVDQVLIVAVTSLVLWVPEVWRLIKLRVRRQ